MLGPALLFTFSAVVIGVAGWTLVAAADAMADPAQRSLKPIDNAFRERIVRLGRASFRAGFSASGTRASGTPRAAQTAAARTAAESARSMATGGEEVIPDHQLECGDDANADLARYRPGIRNSQRSARTTLWR
jgi:hypothetical protein